MRHEARCLIPFAFVAAALAQNKIRTPPSETAARCGPPIAGRQDPAAAAPEGEGEQRRVLWYVPTVARSPMDRKPEIDRYMRGGPFQWPDLTALVGERFVATDEVPKGKVQQELGLVREKFIEPGLVVLDAEGKLVE